MSETQGREEESAKVSLLRNSAVLVASLQREAFPYVCTLVMVESFSRDLVAQGLNVSVAFVWQMYMPAIIPCDPFNPRQAWHSFALHCLSPGNHPPIPHAGREWHGRATCDMKFR